MTPTDALTSILSGGAVESKAALAAMAERGFSAKQSRRAREVLGIQAQRSGFGAQMASIWRLTAAENLSSVQAASVVPSSVPVAARSEMLGFAQVSEESRLEVRKAVRKEVPTAPFAISGDEQRRLERRVVLFRERGADADAARSTAVALVQRDQLLPQQWGSCVECQNFVRQQCSVVRPIAEIHECWLRRHDAP